MTVTYGAMFFIAAARLKYFLHYFYFHPEDVLFCCCSVLRPNYLQWLCVNRIVMSCYISTVFYHIRYLQILITFCFEGGWRHGRQIVKVKNIISIISRQNNGYLRPHSHRPLHPWAVNGATRCSVHASPSFLWKSSGCTDTTSCLNLTAMQMWTSSPKCIQIGKSGCVHAASAFP